MKKLLLLYSLFLPATYIYAQADYFQRPSKGFTSWQPATNWEHALLSGNGTMGAMVIGNPHDETIILSHSLLYLPQKRSASLIDQASYLDTIRQLLLQHKGSEAANIPVVIREKQNYFDARDPFIPAFDIRIEQPGSNIQKYQRSVNFQTGEAITDWKENAGSFQRKVFVSRTDSLIVISIKGTGKINCAVRFERRPVPWDQWNFINTYFKSAQSSVENEQWLHYQSFFTIENPNSIRGYEGLGRVVAKNGTIKPNGQSLTINGADEVLILIKIQPLYTDKTQTDQLKQALSGIYNNYTRLLARHTDVHKKLFDRVHFNLNGNLQEKTLHTEELLLNAKHTVSPAQIERAFDAGRYNIISATGTNPPNLQGLWTGIWMAPWTGGMTNDGNLPTAISMNMPGNMTELMMPYFRYHEALIEDYERSAKALFNCKGIHIPAQQTTTGLDTDFGPVWCLTFWTGGAGWVSHFFWDYYQYTLDRTFLAEHAYPFMKRTAAFYEDFLYKDAGGKLLFNPSYSPENNPANNPSQATLNATMDVMIAKQLLNNCIKAATILHQDEDKVLLWQHMIKLLPSYAINKDGVLQEWIDPQAMDNYNHRHASQLYALYDEVEGVFHSDSVLHKSVMNLLDKKMQFREKEGGGEMAFGLVQLGATAAHLGDANRAYKIVQWLAGKYWSTGMGSFHNVGHLFNMDISGGLPYLISQMLAYSEIGHINLLPALSKEWKQGNIDGLLLRGNVLLDKLEWNEKNVSVLLRSRETQTVTVHLPFATSVTGNNRGLIKTQNNNWNVTIEKDKPLKIKFKRL